MESNQKNNRVVILGIDLAWGSRNPNVNNSKKDGVCAIEIVNNKSRVIEIACVDGDKQLLDLITSYKNKSAKSMILIDAPIVCINKTGMRPVDKLTHRLFHREHAACHPANSTKCSRPIRITKEIKKLGIKIGWELKKYSNLVIEVYPHPAMIRLFKLNRIFKYKKGNITNRVREFRKYQRAFRTFLENTFNDLELNQDAVQLFKVKWSKQDEDKLDALFCGIIGLWHYKYRGKKSEIIGNKKSGFILLPIDLRNIN